MSLSSRRTLVAVPTAAVLASMMLVARATRAQQPPAAQSPEKKVEVCLGAFEEAQLKRMRGKLVAAHDLFAMCAKDTCPAQVRADCVQRRDEVDKALPTASFVVRDASGKDVEATFTLDGAPFSAPGGRAVPIDPGPHVLSYALAGKKACEEKITIQEGEKSRAIVLVARADEPGAAPSPGGAPSTPLAEPSRGTAWPYVTIGVGVAFVGAAVVFGVLTVGSDRDREEQQSRAFAEPDPMRRQLFQDSADSHEAAADSNRTAAIITGVVGFAAIGGGILWYFSERSSSAARLLPRPAVAPGYAGASWGLSF